MTLCSSLASSVHTSPSHRFKIHILLTSLRHHHHHHHSALTYRPLGLSCVLLANYMPKWTCNGHMDLFFSFTFVKYLSNIASSKYQHRVPTSTGKWKTILQSWKCRGVVHKIFEMPEKKSMEIVSQEMSEPWQWNCKIHCHTFKTVEH